MGIKINSEQEEFFNYLESDRTIQEVARLYDWSITADRYALLGLVYMQNKNNRLGKRILDYLCECNFHTSHEALENTDGTDLHDYLKAY